MLGVVVPRASVLVASSLSRTALALPLGARANVYLASRRSFSKKVSSKCYTITHIFFFYCQYCNKNKI